MSADGLNNSEVFCEFYKIIKAQDTAQELQPKGPVSVEKPVQESQKGPPVQTKSMEELDEDRFSKAVQEFPFLAKVYNGGKFDGVLSGVKVFPDLKNAIKKIKEKVSGPVMGKLFDQLREVLKKQLEIGLKKDPKLSSQDIQDIINQALYPEKIMEENDDGSYKTASKQCDLYDTGKETGKGLVEEAHPETAVVELSSDTKENVVENVVEQQERDLEVVSKDPTGKYAEIINDLVVIADYLDETKNTVVANMVDSVIKKFADGNFGEYSEKYFVKQYVDLVLSGVSKEKVENSVTKPFFEAIRKGYGFNTYNEVKSYFENDVFKYGGRRILDAANEVIHEQMEELKRRKNYEEQEEVKNLEKRDSEKDVKKQEEIKKEEKKIPWYKNPEAVKWIYNKFNKAVLGTDVVPVSKDVSGAWKAISYLKKEYGSSGFDSWKKFEADMVQKKVKQQDGLKQSEEREKEVSEKDKVSAANRVFYRLMKEHPDAFLGEGFGGQVYKNIVGSIRRYFDNGKLDLMESERKAYLDFKRDLVASDLHNVPALKTHIGPRMSANVK